MTLLARGEVALPGILLTLEQVRTVVEGWQPMRAAILQASDDLARWGKDDRVESAIDHSLCFGLYARFGFARAEHGRFVERRGALRGPSSAPRTTGRDG